MRWRLKKRSGGFRKNGGDNPMPADVELFDMLRASVLEGMTTPQLLLEVERTRRMVVRVEEYVAVLLAVLGSRLA